MRTPTDPTEKPLVLPPKPAPAPAPSGPTWRPSGTPGIERNADGQLRTVPTPKP
jgi:hypothetical protein